MSGVDSRAADFTGDVNPELNALRGAEEHDLPPGRSDKEGPARSGESSDSDNAPYATAVGGLCL